ncbi:hypothetical protein BLNAU_20311 [Blattamonas nauphoetae]|uniref:Protein kinase domain-containing protein n=1 Tax=Blattamonas nauphoetae TaxID=2049346 RepID=A0ABQ9WZQ3_9EUKA|nr:hypothetical protein BLNAU_20311 [Blattamonas nauphoetae]
MVILYHSSLETRAIHSEPCHTYRTCAIQTELYHTYRTHAQIADDHVTNPSIPSQSVHEQFSNRLSERQRWMAPEVADRKVDIDPSKAAVFSLGLLLWEMETGLVPFGEVDAVNAQRQLGTGTIPLMRSWTNESKIELVRSCLNLDPKERPTLDEISSLLDLDIELGKPAIDKQQVEES